MIYFTEALQRCGHYSMSKHAGTGTSEGTAVDWLRLESQGAALIDYPSLLRSTTLEQKIPELKRIFCDHDDSAALDAQNCELLLNCMGMALHTLCDNALYKQNEKSDFFQGQSLRLKRQPFSRRPFMTRWMIHLQGAPKSAKRSETREKRRFLISLQREHTQTLILLAYNTRAQHTPAPSGLPCTNSAMSS